MSKKEVLSIALKLMGVYFLLHGLTSAPTFLGYLAGGGEYRPLKVGIGLGLLLTLGVCLLLVRRSDAIASLLILTGDDAADSPRPPAADRWDLQYVAFSALGVYAVLKALGNIGPLLAIFRDFDRFEGRQPGWEYAAGTVALLIVGLCLLFGSQTLVNLLRRARQAGHPKA